MFKTPTVFILGAGASWHYNYPTGAALVRRMIEKTELIISCFNNERKQRSTISPAELPNFFREKFPNVTEIQEIINFLRNFINRLDHVDPPVIDYFLGWNPDLHDIGRLIIAWVMLDCEREFDIKKGNNNRVRVFEDSPYDQPHNIKDIKKFNDNWYRFILYNVVSECRDSSDILLNKVSFITFNYDVSLESFLHRGLRAIEFLKKKDSDIDKFLKDRFVHIYGKIRESPFTETAPIEKPPSDKKIRLYRDILDQAYEASKGIRTIDSHDKDDEEAQKKAQEYIGAARRVYILGYGFDKRNNERLKLVESLSTFSVQKEAETKKAHLRKEVYFTNYEDRNSVNKKVSQMFIGENSHFLVGKSPIYFREGTSGGGAFETLYEKSTRDVYEALERDFDFL
jgi:hypothetical protein